MTEMNTPDTTVDSKVDKKTVSDARIILGPLVKYALMGFVIVSVIITTAVMLDRQFNDIDRELAILKSELAAANPATVTNTETAEKARTTDVVITNAAVYGAATTVIAENTETETPAASKVENKIEARTAIQPAESPIVAQTDTAEAVLTESAAKAETVTVIKNGDIGHFDQSIEAVIAERKAYLKEMDRIYLEGYRARQEKQMQYMRQRLAGQKQRIKEMEARYQKRYDDHAGNVMQRQKWRENFLADRI